MQNTINETESIDAATTDEHIPIADQITKLGEYSLWDKCYVIFRGLHPQTKRPTQSHRFRAMITGFVDAGGRATSQRYYVWVHMTKFGATHLIGFDELAGLRRE